MSDSLIDKNGQLTPGRRPPITLVGLALACAALVGALTPAAPVRAAPTPDSFADLVEDKLPAVVNISTTQTLKAGRVPQPEFPPGSPFEELFRDFFDRQQGGRPRQRKVTSLGSGFVYSSSGIIVTNNHVIDNADEIIVTLHDGEQLEAKLVGRDPATDIAILRVKPEKPLTAVKFGNSDNLRVGDWVLAIGNPFGLGGTVTAGIVSGRNRDIGAGSFDDFIQTDASINKGNSGGPLFNTAGEVIGVNTAIFSPTGSSVGIGFAVPSSLADSVVRQILKYGETRRGWIGVRIQTVTPEIAEGLGLAEPTGALVAEVTEGGPAAAAGIQSGDLIVAFDGKKVDKMRALPRIVADTPIGKTSTVQVIRKRKRMTFKIKVGKRDEEKISSLQDRDGRNRSGPASGTERELEGLGLTLAEISPAIRREFKLPARAKGVVVVRVEPGSPADGRVRPGDVIVEVDEQEVTSTKAVANKLIDVKRKAKNVVLFLLNRNGELAFVPVRLADSKKGKKK